MIKTGMESELMALAEEVSQRENCVLYDLEFVTGHRGKGRILRVFIDRSESAGASIDDCANVSRGLSLLLDVKELVEGGHYDLEVSTPGLERRLKTAKHFALAIGKTAKVKSRSPLDPVEPTTVPAPTAVRGTLLAADETTYTISDGTRPWKGLIADIERAQLVHEFPQPGLTAKKKR